MEQRGSDGRFHFVYRTTNLVNGRYYIGKHSTRVLEDRYLGSGKRFWRELNKYGRENFTREILFFCETAKDAFAKEKEFLTDEVRLTEQCLNLQPGGGGGFKDKEHMMKCSKAGNEAKALKMQDDEYAREFSHTMRVLRIGNNHFDKSLRFTGKKHSDETKEKIRTVNSVKQAGSKNSQFGKQWIYSIELNKSIRIDKDQPIPSGWFKGRRIL